MTGPLISVVVPLYKAEDYIEKCLRSIMAQTLRRIEILCVDDCSPDGSAGVVERLARQDDRITLIRHETNRGPGAARNTAIRAARAEFLASVDSDDHVDPDFLERLWDGSEDGYFDVTICGYGRVRPDGTVIDRHLHDKRLILDPLPADQNPIRISGPEVWNKLWRRSLFVDNGIWFPDHIYHQDSATTPLIYMKARNVRFIGGSPYHYLIREGSITQTTSDKHLLDRFRCMDVLKEFILREGSYERLKEAIEDRIYSGYSYHVGHVVKNRLGGDTATDTYLRHLLIMREAYLEHDMTVRAMSLEEKADHLIRHRPRARPGGGGAAGAG
ncbi:MAG: glycosyltransferase family 2 protein, partial [Pseudorhodobacter sp.]